MPPSRTHLTAPAGGEYEWQAIGMNCRPKLIFTMSFLPWPSRRLALRRSYALPILCVALIFPQFIWGTTSRKNLRESPNALQLVLNSPMKDVVDAVQEVAGDQVIYGTQSYQRERNLTGAHTAETSDAFTEMNGNGKVFYKVADGVLSPINFKKDRKSVV